MAAAGAIYNRDTNIVALIQYNVGRSWRLSLIKGGLLMARPKRRPVPDIGFYFDTKTEATKSFSNKNNQANKSFACNPEASALNNKPCVSRAILQTAL